MSENQAFDVVVIGAGPGGYVAAIRASQLGLKTAIVEKQWMGGVCLNVGCIPSKSLLKNADVAHTLRERGKEFGFSLENLKLDYTVAVSRSRQVSDRLVRGVGLLMKKNNITVFTGSGLLKANDTVQVTDKDGKTTELKAKNIILATGSHTFIIPGVTVDGEKIVTYLEAITQQKMPKSVVIIGGGAIGVEFATIWNAYGSEVTIVEMLPRLLPLEDEESSKELTKAYQKRGIKILTGHRVLSVEATENGARVVVSPGEGQPEKVVEAEQAMVAIGFRPNVENLGLEALGVKLNQRGFIEIDEHMATSVPGIYAIGDVTGQLLLAHVASAQGVLAAESIGGVETYPLNYKMMPRATYSHPQVASFGYTEVEAKEQGYEIKVGRFPLQANGKALGLGDYAGFVKIITDAKYGEILGAHMVGPDVSELLPELTLAQRWEITAEGVGRNIHAHPTLSESLMEAAEVAEGHSINI